MLVMARRYHARSALMSGDSPAAAPPPSATSGRPESRLRRWRRQFEIDGAVVYAVLARVWQVLAGPVSLFVILRCYSTTEQGLFYLFGSLLLWHGLVELGLQSIIGLMASHEWAHLRLDATGRVDGNDPARSRLAGLLHASQRRYAGVAILFSIVIGGCGYWLMAHKEARGVDWRGPWVCVVLLSAPSLWMSARVAILEGCNQLGTINRVRCVQAVAGNLAVWSVMLSGGSLWAAVASGVVKLLSDLWLIYGRYGAFFPSLPREPVAARQLWSEEVWPLQWRMGVRTLFAHLGACRCFCRSCSRITEPKLKADSG